MQKIYRDVCGLLLAVIRREARQVMESFIPNATKIQRVHAQQERRLQALEKAVAREQRVTRKKKVVYRVNGETIKKIRKRLKINQRVLARLLDANYVTINRWEHGKHKPGAKASAKIAHLRDMKLEEAEALIKEKTRRPYRGIKFD